MWLKTEGGKPVSAPNTSVHESPRTHVIFDLGIPRRQHNVRIRVTEYSLGELIVRVLLEVVVPIVKLRQERRVVRKKGRPRSSSPSSSAPH